MLIVEFIDAHSFDVRSVKKTCVHIVHPDGRLIPFDTYNFGVTQVLYMVPAILIARVSGRPRLANGLIIGAGLTFLLNAACWGLIQFGLPF